MRSQEALGRKFEALSLDPATLEAMRPERPQVSVIFSESEWADCERLSIERNRSAVAMCRRDSWENNSMTGYDKNAMGMAGEYATSLYLETPRLTDTGPGHYPDLRVGGVTIEVKSTKHRPPHLKFRSEEEFGSDVAVMVLVRPRLCILWGWVERSDFFKRAHRKDYGYGPRWVLRPPYEPMKELKAWTRPKT